jgi:predicted CxxxxCH...CXXCH cytochrome family protein
MTPRSPFAWFAAGLIACAVLFGCNTNSGDVATGPDAGADRTAPPPLRPAGYAPNELGGPSKAVPPVPKGAGFTCEVKTLLTTKCQVCHSNPPAGGALVPLMTVADMLQWSTVDKNKSVAQVSLERMQQIQTPMPPSNFNNPATDAEIQAFDAWIQADFTGFCAGAVPPNATCTTCHGDATRAGMAGADPSIKVAPPVGTNGETLPTQRAVGAHMAHANKADWSANPMQCADCHIIPTSNSHSNGVVDINFGGLAKTAGAQPNWDGATCTASYCHGNFKGGMTTAAPNWTANAPMDCGSCHGTPPPTPPHTNPAIECSTCHGAGYSATAKTVAKATHIDGAIQVNTTAATCSSCHGDGTRVGVAGADPDIKSSPPISSKGETLATTRAVGAHIAHSNLTDLSNRPLQCADCHIVPTSMNHSNGVVDMLFGALSKTAGAVPTWDGTSCNNYCHGNFNGGVKTNTPAWAVPGAQACGSCHGLPPPNPPHPVTAAACSTCHGAGYDATAKTVNKATHLNGSIDTPNGGSNATCTTCHGTTGRVGIAGADLDVAASPPTSPAGSTLPAGAHQMHVNGGTYSTPIQCNECHIVPISTAHSNGIIDIAFGALATHNGTVTPAYNSGALSCSAFYCHGNFTGGNTTAAPIWTGAGTITCGSCHAIPPATAPHTNPAAPCAGCHGAGYDQTAKTVNKTTHINGVVDVDQSTQTCSSCHGTATRVGVAGSDPQVKAAPPTGTHAETATTTLAVGAHDKHLNTGTLSSPVQCNECHVVPISNNHSNGVVDMAWGTLGQHGGVTPVWNASSMACTSSYCHGNFTGGANASASWTTAGLACNGCHANPPPTPAHSNPAIVCSACHGAGYNATAATVNQTTHINGVVDVDQSALNCNSCHGDGTRVGIAGADPKQTSAPPLGTKGETLTTDLAVGAHQAHLNKTDYKATPTQCADCHAVPTSNTHSDGVIQVVFGAFAKTGGVTPAWNSTAGTCTSSYCHGNFTGGTTTFAPVWTGGALACGSCHSDPPKTGRHGGDHSNCANCHGSGYTKGSAVDKTYHMNGKVDYAVAGGKLTTYDPTTLVCTNSCHGNKGTW